MLAARHDDDECGVFKHVFLTVLSLGGIGSTMVIFFGDKICDPSSNSG